jgi:hypothetical protein
MKVALILSVHGRANILLHQEMEVYGKKALRFAARISPLKNAR